MTSHNTSRDTLPDTLIILSAINDFEINHDVGPATYYKDRKNEALAINAAQKEQRNQYAIAKTTFDGPSGSYHMELNTLTENDGESVYIIKINGMAVDSSTNPETDQSYAEVHHYLGPLSLTENDIIQIESKAVTNFKIPEKEETAWSRGRWKKLTLNPENTRANLVMKGQVGFKVDNGFIQIEAEDFHYRSTNNTPRAWYKRPGSISGMEELENHSSSANGRQYIEVLPDTRVTHDDELQRGVNFFPLQGSGAYVTYKIDFDEPGKYYVWTRAFSSGTEDNGVHVGVDGEWPESGARIQLCKGKNQWTWTSAQRVPENHCGEPRTIFLDIKEPGEHLIMFSVREDGFEMDSFILTTDETFQPK